MIFETLHKQGRSPLDGTDKNVYSTKEPIHPFSFLRVRGDNSIPADETQYFPTAPPPVYLSETDLYAFQFFKKDDFLKYASCVIDKEHGGLAMVDEKLTSEQRSFIASLITKLGKSMFSANTIGFSIPARMTEPRTMLDGFADMFRLASFYLRRAGNIGDKIERIKLVTTGMIAPFYLLLRKMKPLNPILGETFEATLSDGTKIAGEQIAHHPPISYYYVEGPNKSYLAYGSIEVEPQFKGTYMQIDLKMHMTIKFKDGHTLVVHKRPYVKGTGVISGTRRTIIKGMMQIEDKTTKLWSATFFDYGEKKGIISSEKTVPKDCFEGIIYMPKPGSTLNQNAKRIADMDDIKTEIGRLRGSWLEKLEINAVNYWNIDKVMPDKMIYKENPLPSDCRFREDLIWLRRQNMDYADAWKDALEIRQRRDRKLREDAKK